MSGRMAWENAVIAQLKLAMRSMLNQFVIRFLGTVCPTDWYYYNGYCYYPSEDDVRFSEARKRCRAMGANLVSITDQNEMDFVLSIS